MSIVDHTTRAIQGAVLASALLIVPAVAQQVQVAPPVTAPAAPAPATAPIPAPAPSPLFARESEVPTIAEAQAANDAAMNSSGLAISTPTLVIVLLLVILLVLIV
jgi:hypothetical protein